MRMHKAQSRRRGATLVETAVVVSLTMLLLVGITDVGIMVWSYNVIGEAAREGARTAVVHGSKSGQPFGPSANDTNVDQAVRNYSFGLAQNDFVVTSSWPDGNNKPYSRVTVQVTYTYRPVGMLNLGTIKMQSATTMMMCH